MAQTRFVASSLVAMAIALASARQALPDTKPIPSLEPIANWVEWSDIVATVRIAQKQGASSAPERSERCGVFVLVEVTESFKGPSGQLRLWANAREDILPGHPDYLLFGRKIDSAAASVADKECHVEEAAEFVASVDYMWRQSLLPFGTREDELSDPRMLLASRESFASADSYYLPNQFVDYFRVINGRIFAIIRWDWLRPAILSAVVEARTLPPSGDQPDTKRAPH